MEHGAEAFWLRDGLVFLVAAGLVVPLLRLARIPAVLGFLLAGIALGPWGIVRLAPEFPLLGTVTISDPEAIEPFAELGILFLLFLLGLEMSFARLWELRRIVFGAGGLQAFASVAAISVAIAAIGVEANAALAIGLALSLSSTAIVMQLLAEQRRLGSALGRTALAILLFQDILVAPILILVGFLNRGTDAGLLLLLGQALLHGAVVVGVIVLAGRTVMRWAFRLAAAAGGRDFLMALTLLAVVGGGLLTAGAGLSLALGAFLAGVLLGETEFKHQTEVDLEPFKGLLLGLFFVTVGMAIDLGVVWEKLGIVLAGLAALLLIKALIAFVACLIFTRDRAGSIEAALLLAPAGEFAFVVIASAASIIASETVVVVLAIASLSMLTTPLLAAAGKRLAAALAEPPGDGGLEDFGDATGHVVVAGFGRVGQTIADILEAEGAEIVGLERQPKLVQDQRATGRMIYLCDASRPEIIARAGAAGAAMFVVTVDDPGDAERMVATIRAQRRDVRIFARARDADHAGRLARAGADFVVPDAIEAGLQIAERALVEIGFPQEAARDRIAGEREAAYRRAADT